MPVAIAANMFHFTCFNVDDPDDPTVGLINGELAIPGNLLRREVFDPVVDQVGRLHSCRRHTYINILTTYHVGSHSAGGTGEESGSTYRRFVACRRFLRKRVPL